MKNYGLMVQIYEKLQIYDSYYSQIIGMNKIDMNIPIPR